MGGPPHRAFPDGCNAPRGQRLAGPPHERLGSREGTKVRRLEVLPLPLTLLLAVGVGLFLPADNGLGEPGGGRPQSTAFPGKPGQIAFARDGKRRGIYVADPSGNGLKRITRDYDLGPAWSPDGRRIAFTRGDRTTFDTDNSKGVYVVN